MKRVFITFLLFVFFTNLYAIDEAFVKKMNYETDYKVAIEKAKQEDKTLMMIVSQKSCPWCRKMEKQTLENKIIKELVKKSFIPLLVDKDSNSFPKKFEAKFFPTTIFIDAKSEKEIDRVLGYIGKQEFKEVLEGFEK